MSAAGCGELGSRTGQLVVLSDAEDWATVFSFLMWPALWEWKQRDKVEPNKPRWLQVLNFSHFLGVPESDPMRLSWKWGTPFSLQNQYFNNDPIQLGCSFLMLCTSSTWSVRTTGRLVTVNLTSDGQRPATQTPCWVCPIFQAGSVLWAGTVDNAHGSCLLLSVVMWLGQNPRRLANWARETSSYTMSNIGRTSPLTYFSQPLHFMTCLIFDVFFWWSLFTGLQHPYSDS